jgi:hypothetical protein
MTATTTEGTGPGSVENIKPRIINGVVKNDNLYSKLDLNLIDFTPNKIDGGVVQALGMLNISQEEAQTILKAAEILRKSMKIS